MDTFPIHQSLSSFLLIVLLFFTPASSAQEDNQRFRDCFPASFDCGSVKIGYPFWTEDTPEYCRPHQELEMKIKCDRTHNSSEIVIQKRPYHVMKIDYKDQKATIVDKYYFLVDKGMIPCHAPSSNTSPDFNPFNYTRRDLNLSFFYNCSDPLAQEHLYLKFPNCSSDDLSDHPNFTLLEYFTLRFINCQVRQIPILSANKDWVWKNPEKFWIDVLAEGFEVMWSFTKFDPHCWDCFESKGHCRFNGTSPVQRDCYCNGTPFPDECPPPPALPPPPSPAPAQSPGSTTSTHGKKKKQQQHRLPDVYRRLSLLLRQSLTTTVLMEEKKTFSREGNSCRNQGFCSTFPEKKTRQSCVGGPIIVDGEEGLLERRPDSLLVSVKKAGALLYKEEEYPLHFTWGRGGIPKMKYIIGAITGVGILILTCCFVFILCPVRKSPSDYPIFFWKKKTHDSRNVDAFLENYGALVPKRYRYSELRKLTNSFKDKLGQGGYGSVFKGNLNDGRPMAVKVLNNSKGLFV
ncbi:hypothetical protein MRB53_018531 [Persea americana]|uniref:Uncharacterized protein n=1 Tax=Persea americana TaxID=3435 RepID=A0ACC2M9L1_PERAE|nr:hypothetical protein MRB53_018531 [Persea americana]